MMKKLAIGFAGVSNRTSALSFNIDSNTVEIPRPLEGETYYVGYTNNNGRIIACYFEIKSISEVDTKPAIEIDVSLKDYDSLEELKTYTIKLSTSWHTFDEIESL